MVQSTWLAHLNALAEVEVGGYVSFWKAIPVVLVFLLWARLLTWADKDADAAHLPRMPLNLANLGGMVVAFGLFLVIPSFWLGFPVLLLGLAAEAGVYLHLRNKKVGLTDLKTQYEDYKKGFRKKKEDKNLIGPVALFSKATGQVMPPPAMESPDRPAYDAVQAAFTDPFRKQCEQLDMAPSPQGVQVKYTVDGVGYTLPAPIDPASAAAAVAYAKGAAGLDVNERRKPQKGNLKLTVDGQRRDTAIQTAGSTAGEYLRVIVDPTKRHNFTLDQLGLTDRQKSMIKESILENQGVVLVAAPKGNGLTSMLYAILRAHDAFIQHIHTIEREPDQDLEGITQNKLAANATPAEEEKSTSWVISQEPDVLLYNKMESPRSAAEGIAFAASGKRLYVGFRAGGTAEAIEAWRKLVGDDSKAFEHLKLVVSGRVLRKLCVACRESYAPDPNTLRKLSMNPQTVTELYKAREVPMRDPKTNNIIPCTFCHELRFKGRLGAFEVISFDETVKDVVLKELATSGKLGTQYRNALRKQGGRMLQEEALGLVEHGHTSVQEVLRVLRSNESAPAQRPAAEAAPVAAGAGGGGGAARAPSRRAPG